MSDNQNSETPDNQKKEWRKLLEDIFVFELAFYLFDLFTRVVREFFNTLLVVMVGAIIVIAIMHFIK